jgi:hypothetical protein
MLGAEGREIVHVINETAYTDDFDIFLTLCKLDGLSHLIQLIFERLIGRGSLRPPLLVSGSLLHSSCLGIES